MATDSITSNVPKVPLGSDGMTYPLGFIHVTICPKTGDTVAGFLVTDNTGIPLEFVITTAVRPTRPQHILYGERLRSYVAVDLCGKELVTKIKTKPQAIFVNEKIMLALAKHTSIPLLLLTRNESFGLESAKPAVSTPADKPEYGRIIDLTSLHMDMMEAFDRIEQCRKALAVDKEEYRVYENER